MYDEPVPPEPLSLRGQPTDALPGSELKVRILTERAARGEPLFHPQDGLPKAGAAVAAAAGQGPWWPSQPQPNPAEVAALPEPPDEVLEDEPDDAAEAVFPLIEYTGQANSA